MFAGEDYDVYIYDSTNALKYTMTEPNNKIYCGDFTNDGCSLAVGSEDNKFYIYTSVLGSCAPAAPPSTPSTPTTDNSTNCSIFTMDVKGCAICYNETFCHECSVGYYVEPDGLCYTCSEAITGCAVCNESTVCISCSPGFYLDGVTCKTC